MPQGPFLALITPIGDAGGGGQPPYPSQGPGFPTHPIAEPPWGWGKPPGYNPRPDQGLPGNQPYPDQGLPGPQPHPEHPIVYPPMQPPQPPLGIWGPNDPRPTPPIYIPIMPPPTEGQPHPEHPIYIPVYPSHPIVIPPGTSPEEIAQKLKQLVEFATGNLPTNPDETPTPV